MNDKLDSSSIILYLIFSIMALAKTITVLGTEFPGYVKIGWYTVLEGEKVDGVKTYVVNPVLDFYTDSTKQYKIKQETRTITGFIESELNLADIYESVKTGDLVDAVDA